MKGVAVLCVWVASSVCLTSAALATEGPGELPRIEVGLGARFMPVGWFNLADVADRDFRAFPALGGEAVVDYRVTPVLSIGAGGEITGNVIPNRADYVVGTMYAVDLRLTARYPTLGRFEPYATVTGGYSKISLGATGDSAAGILIGGWVGVRLRLGAMNRLFGQLGYEAGFQTMDGGAYSPSYLVTELGWLLAV